MSRTRSVPDFPTMLDGGKLVIEGVTVPLKQITIATRNGRNLVYLCE